MLRSSHRNPKHRPCIYEPLERRALLAAVVINGTAGADTIFVEDLPGDSSTMRYGVAGGVAQTMAWSDVDSITVNAGGSADTIHIRRLRGGIGATINGEGGNDSAMLGNGDIDTNLAGSVLFNGGSGTDRIELNDLGDSAGPDTHDMFYASEAGAFPFFYQKTGFPAPGEGVRWDPTTEELFLQMSHLGDTVNVEYNVGNVTIAGATGADHVVWGNGDIDTNIGTGTLRFDGGLNPAGDPDTLLFDDSNDVGGDTHRFDRSGTTGTYGKNSMTGTAEFVGVEDVHLMTGQNQSTTTYVDGLPSNTDLFVEGLLFGADTIIIGGGDLNTNVLGDVSFDGFNDGSIVFDDLTDGPGSDFYTIDFGTFTNAVSTHTFANVSSVTLQASPNNDQINIENSFGYELRVHGNGGDDEINIGGGDLIGAGQATIYGGDGADTLVIDDTAAAGADAITADSDGGGAYVDFNGGVRTRYDSITNLVIDASAHADSITSVAIPSLTTLRIDGNAGVDAIDVQGHPTLNIALLPRVIVDSGPGEDTLDVNTDGVGGARVLFEESQTLGTLNMGPDGRLRLAEGEHLIEVTTSVTMPASGFELDLTDGMFVRRGNPSFSFYWSRLAVGYNGGAWNGLGINSSFAATSPASDGLGVARASELFGGGGTVGGVLLGADDIVIRHALNGDTNLDGTVNLQDFNRLAANFGSSGTTWAQGNFNYDNFTNLLDFNALAGNFGMSAAPDGLGGGGGGAELSKLLNELTN